MWTADCILVGDARSSFSVSTENGAICRSFSFVGANGPRSVDDLHLDQRLAIRGVGDLQLLIGPLRVSRIDQHLGGRAAGWPGIHSEPPASLPSTRSVCTAATTRPLSTVELHRHRLDARRELRQVEGLLRLRGEREPARADRVDLAVGPEEGQVEHRDRGVGLVTTRLEVAPTAVETPPKFHSSAGAWHRLAASPLPASLRAVDHLRRRQTRAHRAGAVTHHRRSRLVVSSSWVGAPRASGLLKY